MRKMLITRAKMSSPPFTQIATSSKNNMQKGAFIQSKEWPQWCQVKNGRIATLTRKLCFEIDESNTVKCVHTITFDEADLSNCPTSPEQILVLFSLSLK